MYKRQAVDDLEPAGDVFAKLEEKLQEAEELNPSDYTEESWKEVQDIIATIDRPVSSDNITEKLAAKMLADLEAAINALEPAKEDAVSYTHLYAYGFHWTIRFYDGVRRGRCSVSDTVRCCF